MATSPKQQPSLQDSFEQKRLKRIEECRKALKMWPLSIERAFVNVKPDGEAVGGSSYSLHNERARKQEGANTPIRVIQFNILASALADTTPKNFTRSPVECLAWNLRKERIIEQILSLDADIICLEEVDHFEDLFQPLFVSLGYKGFFHPKKDSPCLKFENNNGPDGVALFFRTSRLDCVDTKMRYLENEERKPSNQPVLTCMLFDKLSRKNVCVAVTHFKAKKGFEKLRALQAKDTLKAVEEIRNKNDPTADVIVCGDFNGTPAEELYRAMKDHDEIYLDSAYFCAMMTEPPFSTWKIRDTEVKHMIDYIWFTCEQMDVVSYLAPPNEEDVPDHRFPSFSQPSDHILLCCDFLFC